MMLRFIQGGGWIVILAVAIGAWAYREISGALDRAELRGQAEAMAAEAEANWDALVDSLDAWTLRKQAADSAREALAAELNAQRRAARAADSRASEAISGARATIEALQDSVRILTEEEIAAISAGIDSLELANAACNEALGTCSELVDTATARIHELEAQFTQATDLNRQQALTIERLQTVGRQRGMGLKGYLGWALFIAETVYLVVGG